MLRSWLRHLKFINTISNSNSPRGGASPLIFSTASNSGSVENLSQPGYRSSSPSQNALNQSQSSLDNISVDSQSSTGFIIPLSRSSPQDSESQLLSQSPMPGQSLTIPTDDQSLSSGSDSRPQTPLSFSCDPEEPGTKDQAQHTSKRGKHKRSLSTLSFSKLFPSSPHGVKSGEQELKERACEYCLRLLEQSERSKDSFFPMKNQTAYRITMIKLFVAMFDFINMIKVSCKIYYFFQ